MDDDGDGLFDHPDDPECLAPHDNTEHWLPAEREHEPEPRCGLLGLEALLPLLLARRRRARRRAARAVRLRG